MEQARRGRTPLHQSQREGHLARAIRAARSRQTRRAIRVCRSREDNLPPLATLRARRKMALAAGLAECRFADTKDILARKRLLQPVLRPGVRLQRARVE